VNPLSAIYGFAAAGRNRLYDGGTLRSYRLSHPVISVGNISAGGSGKTPFVIRLGELLKERRIKFDVLSRGYGRETRGVLRVNPDGSAREFGDEPLLIAKRLKCPVIVGQSRYQAGLCAENALDSAFHILDDGFQHRSLARDFDIVLLSPEDVRDQLLPIGRLREPLSSLDRADAIVLTQEVEGGKLPPAKPVWRVRRSLQLPEAVSPRRPVAFCGIARPRRFIEQLRELGIRPVAERFYRDHHKYTSADVGNLVSLLDRHRGDGFITTEKDAINLGGQLVKLPLVTIARAQMELINAADALDTMLRVIAERRGKA
jgi:tetraacyldisaccharide 4'-kinase